MTFGRGLLHLWPLDPDATYLNHGTVGVTPRQVLEAQQSPDAFAEWILVQDLPVGGHVVRVLESGATISHARA